MSEYLKTIESLKNEPEQIRRALLVTLAEKFSIPITLLKKDLELETDEQCSFPEDQIQSFIEYAQEKRLKLNIESLDKLTGGFAKKRFVLVAGRTRVGKTTFLLELTKRFVSQGKLVVFFSLEMSKEELTQRLLQSLSGKTRSDLFKLVKVGGGEKIFRKYLKAYQSLIINDRASVSVADMKIELVKLAEKGFKPDVVVIDYLNLIIPPVKVAQQGSYHQTVAISRELMSLAKEANVLLICATQCNRAAEGRPLTITHLLNAGENDAHLIFGLYRPEIEEEEGFVKSEYILECKILKNRDGPTGTVPFIVDGLTFTVKESEF